ncbi:MAG: cardiolipin synthase, partial [Deltaproteobacteria bacterium]|nr:cardiolipin synthase [Deltaproteobacteria bacterium]
MNTWWIVYSLVGVVWFIGNAIVIIMQRRPAASTIAWLLVMVFLPVIGFLVYLLIGPLRLERRKREHSNSKRIADEGMRGLAALHQRDEEHHQLANVSIAVGGSPPLEAESVEIYFDGAATYAAILEAIAAAKDHVHVQYYIWEADTIGTRLRDALIERARAGVSVRVILDGTGARLPKKFLRPLREAGAKVAWFNPVHLWSIRRRRIDFRSHRKIVVCDGRIGFTGGMNVCDQQSAEFSNEFWRDTHLRIIGPAVWPIQRLFFEDWYYVAEELLPVSLATVPPAVHAGAHLVQIVGSGPDAADFALHKVYFTAINQATRRIWLTTPYFVPDDALLTALLSAALRGVDVRVLVPKRGDSRIVDYAARSYFPELLEAKARIFEYGPRFIHAKTMLCDHDVAIIGTANFDNRSFRLDFELAAILFGEAETRLLADSFERDLTDSRELVAADLAAQSFGQRLGQSAARLLSPLL